MQDHKCWHYDAIEPKGVVNCLNCKYWGWTKCRDEKLIMARFRETEELMRHDSFERGPGGIRQTRRGT